MDESLMTEFKKLANDLSPENLCCDGELCQAEVGRKYNFLMKEWKLLEKKAGRKVTEDEVWGWVLKKNEVTT